MRGSMEPKSSKGVVLAAAGMMLPSIIVCADTSGAPSNNESAPSIATAQNGDAAVPREEAVTAPEQLATVVVTATKRASTAQTAPLSLTAVTSEEIASRGITDFETLAQSVPGLAMRSSGGPGQTEFEMRGLNSQGGNSSVVGFYLDEIPLSSPT